MTPAMQKLKAAQVPFTLHRYRHDPRQEAYAKEAAAALGIPLDRLFKTLVIRLDGQKEAIALVPGSKRLDFKAVAETMGAKRAAMASPEAARRVTGCVIGGISPLGHRKPLPAVIDQSALDHETLFVSAGKRGLQMELNVQDLIRICNATVGKISR